MSHTRWEIQFSPAWGLSGLQAPAAVGDFPWSLVFVLSGGRCFKAEARTGKGLCSYSFGEGLVRAQTWQPQRPADVVRSRVAACRLRVS